LVQFNRFDSHLQKIADPINIPDTLALNDKDLKLVAYVVHVGQTLDLNGLDYSHYITYINSG
jgi:prolyl-tRNA editing enzyme YbaK/EbsC (Cys-tRNA(Pro) deacylase)